jgi:hypothetical protein
MTGAAQKLPPAIPSTDALTGAALWMVTVWAAAVVANANMDMKIVPDFRLSVRSITGFPSG